tara:strand:+ start:490 stop:717 length:228 start_codon:yes stop_codon:yes gene_type:complete
MKLPQRYILTLWILAGWWLSPVLQADELPEEITIATWNLEWFTTPTRVTTVLPWHVPNPHHPRKNGTGNGTMLRK